MLSLVWTNRWRCSDQSISSGAVFIEGREKRSSGSSKFRQRMGRFSELNMSFVPSARLLWSLAPRTQSRYVTCPPFPLRQLCRQRCARAMVVNISYSDDLEIDERDTLGQTLREDAENLLSAALRGQEAELSVLLCSDKYIQQLNQIWRQVSSATDVLSFPQDDPFLLGDVVLSVHTASRQARERNYSLLAELRVLLVHGLLHLLGYDHETSSDELHEMAAAEAMLLRKLGWEGSGLIAATTGSVDENGCYSS